MENKVIVGVSGGPDSMYLLNKLIIDKKIIPIVAHVNYHLRDSSKRDEDIVREFCKKHNVDFNILDVTKKDWEETPQKNKQSKARHLRYEFFRKVAKDNETDLVYIGHHLDDWIETAIMLEEKSDDYLYYGIKSESTYKNLTIMRPLLNIYKEEIIKRNIENETPYGLDETNDSQLYTRNKIRMNLMFISKKRKREIMKHYQMINKSKIKLEKKVSNLYLDWKETDFDWSFYNKIKKEEIKRQVIYRMVTRSGQHINISYSKIDAIIDYLKTISENKKFRLMKDIDLVIIKGKIYIQTNNE